MHADAEIAVMVKSAAFGLDDNFSDNSLAVVTMRLDLLICTEVSSICYLWDVLN